jgi:hypothetical protein
MWHFYIHYPEFLQPGTHKTKQLSDYDIFRQPDSIHPEPSPHHSYLGCTPNQSRPFGYLLQLLFKGIKVPFLVFWGLQFLTGMLKDQDIPSGSFTAKQVDGVGDKRLGYATTVVIATCKPFWRTSRLGIICLNLPKY